MSGIIILVLTLVSWLGTRRMQRVPGRLQGLLEMTVGGLNGLVENATGPSGRKYTPLIGTLFIYIFCANALGLIPMMRSPTSGLSTTLALALVAIIFVHFQAVREIGPVSYVKHFLGEPLWLSWMMLPIHIIGELARPLSLSLRLYGNIMGEDTILAVLVGIGAIVFQRGLAGVRDAVPYVLMPPMIGLAMFTSLVQAYVFSILAALYLAGVMPHHAEHVEITSSQTAASPISPS